MKTKTPKHKPVKSKKSDIKLGKKLPKRASKTGIELG